jgi:phosphoribosylglycinamide formyltransferase-1
MKKVALLASGSGSNVENIVRYFQHNKELAFFVLSNKKNAFVHERAQKLGLPSYTIDKTGFENGEALRFLLSEQTDFIVLAGFLLKIPGEILNVYPGKVINIHPALLPKYGGKGMYGLRVHEAVVAAKETESGVTIHYVNEKYDEGQIIFQSKCEVLPTDTAHDVEKKVHALEYRYFPEIINQIIRGKRSDDEEIQTSDC